MKEHAKELPLVKKRISKVLLMRTLDNGFTLEEQQEARMKARELIDAYGLDPAGFPDLAEPSVAVIDTSSEPEAPKTKKRVFRNLGIGKLARQLIVDHPTWLYTRVAEEVNARIEGAQATEKSIRSYVCQMRKEGIECGRRYRRMCERNLNAHLA